MSLSRELYEDVHLPTSNKMLPPCLRMNAFTYWAASIARHRLPRPRANATVWGVGPTQPSLPSLQRHSPGRGICAGAIGSSVSAFYVSLVARTSISRPRHCVTSRLSNRRPPYGFLLESTRLVFNIIDGALYDILMFRFSTPVPFDVVRNTSYLPELGDERNAL